MVSRRVTPPDGRGDPRARRVGGFGTRAQSRLRRTGRRVAARGGRRRARRRRDARRVARARTRARTRGDDTAVPEPRRRTRTIPGSSRGGFLGRGRGASGSSVSGERALASIGQTFGRRGGETGGVSMRVASEGRCDVGAAAGRSASRRERRRRGSDRRGESRDGGVASRDVAERQHAPRGERAVSVLGVPRTREGGRGGGRGGARRSHVRIGFKFRVPRSV